MGFMTTKTRKITAVLGIAFVLSAATLCSYGDDTTPTYDSPSVRIGAAQAAHKAWQTAAFSGGGIEPATTQPETHVIRHEVLISIFDELFAQLADLMDMLRLAILATK